MTFASLRIPLLVVGAALGVLAIALAIAVGPLNVTQLVIYVAIGWSFVGAGTVAWLRRPANRTGVLMVIAGVVYLSRDVMFWHTSVGEHLNVFLLGVFLALIAHQLVVYPHGRTRSRPERFLVGAAYLLAVVGYLVGQWSSVANDVVNAAASVLALAILVLVAVRWRRARPPGRRVLAPIVWTAPAAIAVAVLGFVRDSGISVGEVLNQIEDNGAIVDAAIPIAFLVGLLGMRLHRAGMTDLVVELSRQPPPDRVRAALANALGDPSLEIALWLPEQQRYVDLEGATVELPAGGARVASIVQHGHQPLAALIYDRSLLEDPSLVEAAAAAARLALENARLQAELQARLTEVRASRARILAAGDEERRRLERDLHDGAQQRLLATRLALQLVRDRAPRADPEFDALLAEADAEVQGALEDIRAFARGLHPAILTEDGLGAALATLARRAPLPVEIAAVPSSRLPRDVETAAYFVAAEAVTNAAKYAGASRVRVHVERRNGRALIVIDDDGIGGAVDSSGGGLSGLRDRVEALGGTLELDSPIGRGTRLQAEIPCA